jgi:hypothetical protein
MATHDYVIANGTGAAVRSDLNNALAAIVSNNSGSSEPGTTYAYQWWADTNANVLKIRNSANNAWITLRELDGTMLIEDGSNSAPGLAFADDTNTGIYSPGADQIGFATAGVQRLVIETGEVVVNDPSNDVDFRVESNGNTHMLFVDAGNDRVGVGQSSPASTLHTSGSSDQAVTIQTTTSGADSRINFRNSSGTDAGGIHYKHNGNHLTFNTGGSLAEQARIDSSGRCLLGTTTEGDAVADNLTIADSGDCGITLRSGSSDLGSIYFSDATSGGGEYAGFIEYNHSSNYLRFGTNALETIRILSDGKTGIGTNSAQNQLHVSSAASTPCKFQSSGQGSMYLRFQNTNNDHGYLGYETKALAFYASNNGGTSADKVGTWDTDGIKFGTDTSATNALSDYEEGTWSATLSYGTCTTSDAKYVKIGKLVRISATLSGFSDRSSSAGVQITNPPYASNGGQQAQAAGTNVHRNLDLAINTSYVSSTGNIEFYAATSGSWSQLAYNDLNSSSSTIYFFAQYQID